MKPERKLWNELLKLRLSLIGLLVFAVITALSIIYQARWVSIIIDRAIFAQASVSELRPAFYWLLGYIVLRGIIQFLYQTLANRTGSRIVHKIRIDSIQHILPMIAKRDGRLTSGRISTLFTDKLDALKLYYAQYVAQMILAAVIPLMVLFFIFPVDWITAIVFLITAPLIPFFMALIGSQSKKATEYRWGYLSRLADHFADHIRGMEVLKQFNQAEKSLHAIEHVSTRYAKLTMEILKVTFLSALALELLTTLSTAVVAVEIGLRLLASAIDFQTAFFILLIAPEFYLPLRMLGLRFHAGMQGKTAAIELYELLGEQITNKQQADDKTVGPSHKMIELAFEDVSFHYADDEREILANMQLNCKPGTVSALIGRSGSGKSTVAKLALRFLQPDHGRITMNSIPADEIPLDEWYQQIAWIGQKSFYAEGTILENIQFANPSASSDDVGDVLARVGLLEKVNSLPDGLHTLMDEFGQNFSGGELQRLQLARALVSSAPFLVLDEPTSQMDPDLEQLFIAELSRIKKHKTILLIAHRLQTVMQADQILLLEGGSILERGTHPALMQLNRRYAEMISTYRKQG